MAELTNFAYGYLASGISSSDVSFSLKSGEGARFPASAFYVVIADASYDNAAEAYQAGYAEVVLVSSRTGDTFSITRAQLGTSAKNFNTSGRIYRVTLDALNIHLLPKQTGYSGKFLKTDGTDATWQLLSVAASSVSNAPAGSIASIDVQSAINELDTEKEANLPSQTGNDGKFLYTSGSAKSWQNPMTQIFTSVIVLPGNASTQYFPVGGVGAMDNINEARVQYLILPYNGVIKDLYVFVASNNAGAFAVTIRNTGADTVLAVSNGTGSAYNEYSNTADVVNVTAGNGLKIKYVTSGSRIGTLMVRFTYKATA